MNDFGILFITIAVVSSFMIAALVYVVRRESQRMARLQLKCCLRCGYDLRASKDCCPECGTPIGADLSLLDEKDFDTVKLREDLPDEILTPIKPLDEQPMAAVCIVRNRILAELLSAQLRVRGVWATVRHDDPDTIGALPHTFRVFVTAQHQDYAAEVIRLFRKGILASVP